VVATANGAPFVWVADEDGTVSRRPVAMGATVGDGVILTDGVEPGEIVVTAGLGALREGMRIRPLEAPAS
jgi:multidrug efflux pump subunit AcrA (membrane-fusion protein)